MRPDRRKFLNDTIRAALGGASLYSAMGNLQLLQAATMACSPASLTGYKALVCVFLYGGNDGFNTIVPRIAGQSARVGYDQVRPSLAIPIAGLNALNAPTSGFGSPGDGCAYGLHPAMPELAGLFNAGKAAIVANVGTLVQPVTKAQYQNGTVPLPPQLFSHSDQAAYWQSSPPSNQPVTGWGGRIADLVACANPSGVPFLTSLDGQDAFVRGDNVAGYVMNSYGPARVDFPYDPVGAGTGLENAFNALQAAGQANALERTYGAAIRHSIGTADIIQTALNAAPAFTTQFAGAGNLGEQLQTVAKLIWAANNPVAGYPTGLKRQVFFVSAGGYDTHGGQLDPTDGQGPLLLELSKALTGFYNALNSVSLANNVTAFTASDFGRSLSNNEDGTDHGWASHHFVVGGAVQGGKFYGDNFAHTGQAAMPSLNPSATNPNDGDYGQMIPTTSVEQYAATLAKWFGISDSDVGLILPNLSNFTTRYLTFV